MPSQNEIQTLIQKCASNIDKVKRNGKLFN